MPSDRTEEIREVFAELINTGVGHAAASLNQLIGREIRLTLPAIHLFSGHLEFRKYMMEKPFGNTVAISQTCSGDLNGTGVLVFPVSGGKTLVNMLIAENDPTEMEQFNVIELDAIAEVGNLILNAVQSTICDMTDLEVKCSLPQILFQESGILLHEEDEDNTWYIICEMIFSVAETDIEGMVYLVYTYPDIEMIMERILR